MATQPAAATPVIVLPINTSSGLLDINKYAEPKKEMMPDKTENNFRDFNLSEKYPIGILNNICPRAYEPIIIPINWRLAPKSFEYIGSTGT